MSRLGAFRSDLEANIVCDANADETTGTSTTAAALEDITGLTFDLVVPANLPGTARILAWMAIQCSTTGGSPATGAWAISINAVDKTEIQRYLSGSNDTGALVVFGATSGLSNGTYTVKGRHRRVSGASTVNDDVAQLFAQVVME